MQFLFIFFLIPFLGLALQFELNPEQNLKFSSCVNVTKARMANKNDSTFSDVVDNMMIATGGTKDENTKQLLSISILLCYKHINVTYAKAFENVTIEEIDPLKEENKKLLNLEMLKEIYKEKDIRRINGIFEEIKEVKKELGIYDPEEDADYGEYQKSMNEEDEVDDSIIVESKYSKVIGYALLIILFVIGVIVVLSFLSSNKEKRTKKSKKKNK